jgi:endonuclease/exonuclease/phosphatase family metal-dependent hydrolase
MKRRWLWLVIPILVVVWGFYVSHPGSQVEGCLDGCASSGGHSDGILRMVSLNMLHGFPNFKYLQQRLEIIADEITRLDADIVLLQEVPWTLKTRFAAEYLAEQTGMNLAYLRANGNRWTIFFEEGEAILSRYPLQNPGFVVLQPRARFFENRVALHAIAVTPLGNIDLFVTHLTHTKADVNFEQVQSLIEFIEENRNGFAIIAGDFNAPPDTPQIQILQSYWMDTFGSLNPEVDGFTCCSDDLTVKEANPDKRIDYIFVAPGESFPIILASERVFAQPFQTEDGWLWASDHIGMMFDLAFEEE